MIDVFRRGGWMAQAAWRFFFGGPAAPATVADVKRVREVPVCGWKAVAAVFARRPECVRRLFFDPDTGRRAGEYSRYLAQARRIYRQIEPAELEKVAGTVHHGGIVAITERAEPAEITPPEITAWAKERRPLLVLDRVANHHNLGALVRTAAFFGVRAIIYGVHRDQALPGESTYRIAEGGMEFVELRSVESLPRFLRGIRPHYATVGAALQGDPLDRVRVATGPGARPVALVLGNEEEGLAPAVLAACEHRVLVAGVGAIESLNVSAAGSVLMHWFFGRER
jgi:RNA methyltransferase, TrmH family